MKFTIPEATCGTNQLLRKFRHPNARAKERDKWHWLVYSAIERPEFPFTECNITVTRVSRNAMDWDNMGGGLKFLLDALTSNKIIADDRPSVVRELKLNQTVDRQREAHTIVEIEVFREEGPGAR